MPLAQAFHLDVFQADGAPCFARQDHQLACHIHAGQIVARVRFGIAHAARLRHQFGERHAAVVFVEQPGQRAGENAFNGGDCIAGIDQIAQRGDHRQAGAHGGFVTEARTAGIGRCADCLITRERAGTRLFIRRHHMDAGSQPACITVRDFGAAAAIDDHRVRQMCGQQMRGEAFQIGGRGGRCKRIAPVADQAALVQQHASA